MQNSREKNILLFFGPEPSNVSPFSSLLSKSNSKRVPSGTREMLLLYVEQVPSFREIGKVRRKQCGPWTIEGSLMYLVACEDGNSRVNAKWLNGKDKGRQRRWKQKWGVRYWQDEATDLPIHACIHRTCWRTVDNGKIRLILRALEFSSYKNIAEYFFLLSINKNLDQTKDHYFRRYWDIYFN